ncbi:putative HTH-type transcriptional regulator YetL [Dulcicalothrix desertica PCC 7102]|uniref:Putative HTH-type transcriptional regulator YetL n=1 Tax=Dulcicalothrix desertica PCC 7102 TaxID=232991 RepID=A0A3S1IFI7_9CYAN|nr:MarR family transcriptional regulator [Dulcicalothrix desertica]RUS96642.1 putative HTH-type transcriptional regulator YetL [Dulcicalothrix desertica PCC 7102]TWH43887.1 DNA-binding MarR family transcriptional regulator [Dulcicalothrix desertica PCC 7102]
MRTIPNRQAIDDLKSQYPELDVSSVEACLTFLDATSEVYAAFDIHFARYGLSIGKFTLLMQLYVAPEGLTPSEFADRVGVTRATITGLLDGLEREELVKREAHPNDRRRLIIRLTEKGKQLVAKVLPDHFCRTTGLMANLTPAEKKTLIKLLNKVQAGAPALSNPDFTSAT